MSSGHPVFSQCDESLSNRMQGPEGVSRGNDGFKGTEGSFHESVRCSRSQKVTAGKRSRAHVIVELEEFSTYAVVIKGNHSS